MSAGDSAEEFISVHALGRERLLFVLWSSVNPLKILFFALLGDDREFSSQFCTHQPPNVFLTGA